MLVKDSRTPGPASLGPNIVPTQAVKYTASATGRCDRYSADGR